MVCRPWRGLISGFRYLAKAKRINGSSYMRLIILANAGVRIQCAHFTGQLDVVLAGGYTVLDNGVFEVAPFIGVKGFFRGYWLSEIVEDDSWNSVLRDETRDFNFFTEQISLALGIDIQIKSKKTNRSLLSLQFEYSPLRSELDFWRMNSSLCQSADVGNPFTIRLGINLGK